MQSEVEALAATVGCAVLVEDVRHKPLWWSAQGEVDAVRSRSILQREVPPLATALVARLGLARALGPVRTPALPEEDMSERWCVPLRDNAQLLGYLWVLDAERRISEDDLAPVLRCAEVATMTLARTDRGPLAHGRRRSTLLARLLAGPNPAAAGELMELEDLGADTTVAVNAPLTPGGWALPDGASVHVNPPAAGEHTSGVPVPLLDLAVAAQRAAVTLRALRAGAALSRPSWDALGSWHLIVAAPPELAPGQLHPGADILLAQKRPELLVTARCVLDNGGDVTGSSTQLHVHRTTLYYRLDRIKALTGVDLRLAAGREDLHLALQLAAYRSVG
ncbi:MAG: helix-turn-helix domain-containing protein [Jatrophihabitans sp.]